MAQSVIFEWSAVDFRGRQYGGHVVGETHMGIKGMWVSYELYRPNRQSLASALMPQWRDALMRAALWWIVSKEGNRGYYSLHTTRASGSLTSI